MKIKSNIIIVGILSLVLVTCLIQKQNNYYIGNWVETDLDFFQSFSFQQDISVIQRITDEKYFSGYENRYVWLRDSVNLLTTFNTFKKIGIKRFVSERDYNKILFEDNYRKYDWAGLTLHQIVLKLINSYEIKSDTSIYYAKFWKRRINDKNSIVVFEILNEINQIYNKDAIPNIEEKYIDNKLYKLMLFNIELYGKNEFELKRITLEHFNYLKQLGLEHSAYNLIFELDKTEGLLINRDSLLNTLVYDTISEIEYRQTRNNGKWIDTYLDNGP